MASKLSRRVFLRLAGMGAIGVITAACQPKIVEQEKIVKETVVQQVEKAVTPTLDPAIQGELSIDMSYVPGKVTADTPKALYEILRIAEEYQDAHPGVKVKFEEPFKVSEAMTQANYYLTGAAAGTLPDITFTYQASAVYDKGVLLPTTDFLKEPNDYIPAGKPGHDRWIDQWFEDTIPKPEADGNTYSVPLGWGGPGLVIGYNKEMFKKVGITSTPKTYYDLYLASDEILKSGVIPCESKLMSWEWDWMVDYLLRAMDIYKLIDVDGNGICTDEEETRAVVAGIFRLDCPAWVEPTRIWKAATKYYQPGYLQMLETTTAIGIGEIFMVEQTAMLWNAGQIWARLMTMGGSAKWGVFNIPRLTKQLTPWAAEDPEWLLERGSGQKTLTKTCAERKHTRMAVDFLKFVTTPINTARMIEESLGTSLILPTIKGVDVAVDEDVKGLLTDFEKPHVPRGFSSDRIGDWHFWYEWWNALQAYLMDTMTLEQMIKKQQEVLPQFVDTFVKDRQLESKLKEWQALQDQYKTPIWGEYTIPAEPFVMPFSS